MKKIGTKLLGLTLIVCLTTSWAFAQEDELNDDEMGLGVGISTGTRGMIGLDVAYRFWKPLTVKVGFNHFKTDVTGLETQYGDTDVLGDITITKNNIDLLVEWGINPRRNIRLVTGLGFFIDDEIRADVSLREGRQVNDIVLTAEDIGTVTSKIGHQSSVMPYFGIGFGRSIPKARLNFSADMGAYYTGDYKVEMEATNQLRANDVHGPTLENNLNNVGAKWWPVLSFRLAYRIM